MTKAEELTQDGSTFNRTKFDEPIFILAGRDCLAPETVERWAELAEANGVHPDKIQAARRQAQLMALWQVGHGSKLPD